MPKFFSIAYAATDWDNPKLSDIVTIFNRVYNAAIYSVGAIFIIWTIISGIRYLTAGGDEKAVAAARRSLTFAVLGFILVIAAHGIIVAVRTWVGADITIPIFDIPSP